MYETRLPLSLAMQLQLQQHTVGYSTRIALGAMMMQESCSPKAKSDGGFLHQRRLAAKR